MLSTILKTSIQRNSQRILLNNTTRTISSSNVNKDNSQPEAKKNIVGIEKETLQLLQNSVRNERVKPNDIGQRFQKMHRAGDIYHPQDLNDSLYQEQLRQRRGRPNPPSEDPFDVLGLDPLHEYKNYRLLSHFVSDMGKILPREKTGLTAKNQRKLAKAVKRARAMGIMSSTNNGTKFSHFYDKHMTDTSNPTERTSLLNDNKKEEKWSDLIPHIPVIVASCVMSIVVGLNDGTIGFMIPIFKDYYQVSYQVLSLLFLCNSAGYIIFAPLNGYFVHRFGQKNTLILAGFAVLLAYLIIMNGFDFKITCLTTILQGGGIAILDAGMNVCTAHLPFATFLLNIVHAVFGLGAMIAPSIGILILKYDISWRYLYVCICCFSLINILVISFTIKNEDEPTKHEDEEIEEEESSSSSTSSNSRNKDNINQDIHPILNKVTLLCAFYILIYVGLEVTLGGWGNAYLREAKHGSDIASSQVLSYYWAALATGRIALGYLSGRYGEKLVINICTLLCVFCVLGIWLIDNFISVSIVFVCIGFSLGPMFPTTISLASKVLPKKMHPTSIGFIAGVGASGAASLPFISGLIAGHYGMAVLPILCFGMALIMEIAWVMIPNQ
ncbi:unnamed protein product [Cunninghamella blakesleeana]